VRQKHIYNWKKSCPSHPVELILTSKISIHDSYTCGLLIDLFDILENFLVTKDKKLKIDRLESPVSKFFTLP